MQAPSPTTVDAAGAPEPSARPALGRWTITWKTWSLRLGATLLALLLSALLTLSCAWWWTGTEGSLATALHWLARYQTLSVEGVSGSLRGGGRVDRLSWQAADRTLSISAREVDVAWQAQALLGGKLQLDRLHMGLLRVEYLPRADEPPATPPVSLLLPLPVSAPDLRVDQLQWAGSTAVPSGALRGAYDFNGVRHQLKLSQAELASGRYQGQAELQARGTMALDLRLTGSVQTVVPGSAKPLLLDVAAQAEGPLSELRVQATLKAASGHVQAPAQGAQASPAGQPAAQLTARVMPWASQILPEAQASFSQIDLAALWPSAPRTRLTGHARVLPKPSSASPSSAQPTGWLIELEFNNTLPGAWNQKLLPLDQLQASAEWRSGVLLVSALDARVGAGRLQAQGSWATAGTSPAPGPGKALAPDWRVKASFERLNTAAIDSRWPPQSLAGETTLTGASGAIAFDTQLQTDGRSSQDSARLWALRDALAKGVWRPQAGAGTLELSALRVRSSQAELTASGQYSVHSAGAQGQLRLTAPGLDLSAGGEARPSQGEGHLQLQISNAQTSLRWLHSLPGLSERLPALTVRGRADLSLAWQGGWRDPALQGQLDVAALDWASTAAATPAPAPEALKISELKAVLQGRLSQSSIRVQARASQGARQFSGALQAQGSAVPGEGARLWADGSWQATVGTFHASVQDPALGAGLWQLQSQRAFGLRGRAGLLTMEAGQALLSNLPTGQSANTNSDAAVLAWQPARWQGAEITTAGSLQGLPLAWAERVAGPLISRAGLVGDMLFDGRWDAVLGPQLKLKAELARRSGDISLLAEAGQGQPTRVSAGVRDAKLTLNSQGEDLTLGLLWNSERAGRAEGQLRTRLQRASAASATPALASQWHWPADAAISGELNAQLPRLGAWSMLTPPGWRLRGSLSAQLSLRGTRLDPQLGGVLQANDLVLRSVVDGIELGKGRLRARLDGLRMHIDEFSLQGAGANGAGGQVRAQGVAGWVKGQAQLQARVQLDKLRASVRSDRQLTISGDLQASLAGLVGEISGRLKVDQARFILPAEDRPQLSSDVVVRGSGANIEPGKAATAPTGLPRIKVAVELDLGQDLRVEGKGVQTQLRGTLAMTSESMAAPRLIGTVSTHAGEYQAYGQHLNIEQGLLRFNGPIDNPALDVLAIRPNLTQRVGVQITGTALLPRVRLYAEPELPDAEKLSWLVVGRASASGGAETALLQQAAIALLGSKSAVFNGGLAASLGLDELSLRTGSSQADGSTSAGAITLGKRFSRNFYASYERSLSGALGTLYVFYELSQRLTVRAQTGERTAVDLIFTVPYD
jgi:translocation and assembly module TamB